MLPKKANRERVLPVLDHAPSLSLEAVRAVSQETGVPAADVYGTASFYTLIGGEPRTRVCQGLSCQLAGADALLARLRAAGEPVEAVSWRAC